MAGNPISTFKLFYISECLVNLVYSPSVLFSVILINLVVSCQWRQDMHLRTMNINLATFDVYRFSFELAGALVIVNEYSGLAALSAHLYCFRRSQAGMSLRFNYAGGQLWRAPTINLLPPLLVLTGQTGNTTFVSNQQTARRGLKAEPIPVQTGGNQAVKQL